jgi:hypothetical protein
LALAHRSWARARRFCAGCHSKPSACAPQRRHDASVGRRLRGPRRPPDSMTDATWQPDLAWFVETMREDEGTVAEGDLESGSLMITTYRGERLDSPIPWTITPERFEAALLQCADPRESGGGLPTPRDGLPVWGPTSMSGSRTRWRSSGERIRGIRGCRQPPAAQSTHGSSAAGAESGIGMSGRVRYARVSQRSAPRPCCQGTSLSTRCVERSASHPARRGLTSRSWGTSPPQSPLAAELRPGEYGSPRRPGPRDGLARAFSRLTARTEAPEDGRTRLGR